MSRGVGVTAWLADVLEPVEPLLAVLTQTGDTWLLGAVVALLFVLGGAAPLPGWDRRRGVAVLGAGLLAIAVTGLLKVAFGWPRPPGAEVAAYAFSGPLGDVYAWLATADHAGFPSGHAVGSTAVFGTVAGLVDRRVRRRALVVAGVLVATASLTRLGLGLHYLVDVVAGVAVGLLLASLAVRWVSRPGVVVGAAVPAAAAWAVITDGVPDAVGALGLCAGALVAWTLFERRLLEAPAPSGRTVWLVGVGGLALAGVTVVAIEAGGTRVAGFGGFVGMALLVALPLSVGVGKERR